MNDHQKLIIRHRLGLALQKLLAQNKQNASGQLVNSLHQLAAGADIEYYIVQKVSSGKKDPQWTTFVSIAAGFNISVSKLAATFESITDEEAMRQIEKQKRDTKKKIAKKK